MSEKRLSTDSTSVLSREPLASTNVCVIPIVSVLLSTAMYYTEGLTLIDILAGSAPSLRHPWLARQTILKWCLARSFLVEVLQCHGSTFRPLGHVLLGRQTELNSKKLGRGLTPVSKAYMSRTRATVNEIERGMTFPRRTMCPKSELYTGKVFLERFPPKEGCRGGSRKDTVASRSGTPR